MSSAFPIALSGMNAAQLALDSAAHNIANAATLGFKRQLVQQTPAAQGQGVEASVTRSEQTGESLETDMVGLLQGKNAFLANLAVFRTSERMTGALLDISA